MGSKAEWEMQFAPEFDLIIVNDNLEKAQQETFDFNSKRITEQTEKIRKNKEIISKQIEGFNKTNEIFTKNKEVIKNQSLKIENQAIEIKKGEHAIESMRAIGKSVRDDLERTVSDFNAQDKQVLNILKR